MSQPVSSINPYNTDTEAPTDEDAYIATVSDPNTQTQLCWVKYLERLSNGAWGDHIAIQDICEMLNITINVLSTQNPTMTPLVPSNGTSSGNVYIGLIEQYHYVVLEATTDSTNNSVDSTNDNSTEELSDDIIEQGDEHTRQITGGPWESSGRCTCLFCGTRWRTETNIYNEWTYILRPCSILISFALVLVDFIQKDVES